MKSHLEEDHKMSTTWYIAKEYLKRLEINFEENDRKTFSLYPYGPTETKEIELNSTVRGLGIKPVENWN